MVTEIMNSAQYPFYRILSKQFDNPSHARTRGDQLTFGRTQELCENAVKVHASKLKRIDNS